MPDKKIEEYRKQLFESGVSFDKEVWSKDIGEKCRKEILELPVLNAEAIRAIELEVGA